MKTQTYQITEEMTWVVRRPQKTANHRSRKSQLQTIREIARKVHSDVPQVIKKAGMIDTPIIEGSWRFEPLTDFSSIPPDARKRLELILNSISPQGVIIGHEIDPKVETKPQIKPLPWVVTPEVEPKPQIKPLPWVVTPEIEPFKFPQPTNNPLKEIDWREVGRIAWDVTKIVGGIALVVLSVLGIVVGAFAGCVTDPMLIICTQEDEWVEIYRFYS
jgi:hypothetical protein